MMGYLSEVSNPLMNYRWWLIHTLQEHWIGFAVVNVLIIVSFALRIVLMGYLLAFEARKTGRRDERSRSLCVAHADASRTDLPAHRAVCR